MASYLQTVVFLLIVGLSVGHPTGYQQPDANESKISKLENMVDILQQQITDLMEEREHDRSTMTLTLKELSSLQNKVATIETNHLSRNRKAVDPTLEIAFTAVLNNDMANIGATETIIFDHPVLNLGNHYNKYTGVFTAPVDGIYSFTFFIGLYGNYNFYADLTVNNNLVVSATTEGTHDRDDNQGGNSAIVHLSTGDVVQIKHHTYGSSVESGEHGAKITTFSGFLIFPQESEPTSVIGK